MKGKLSKAQIKIIKAREIGVKRLARKFGVNRSTIKYWRNKEVHQARVKRWREKQIAGKLHGI